MQTAKAEKINQAYLGRVLRLTLLALDIVEAILGGRQPEEIRLEYLLERFSFEWESQSKHLAHSGTLSSGRAVEASLLPIINPVPNRQE